MQLLWLLLVFLVTDVVPAWAAFDAPPSTAWDLTPVIQAVVSVAVAAIGIVGTWLITRLAQRFGLQVDAQRQQQFEVALTKLVQFGASQTTDLIKARGWDHVDVKNATVAVALNAAEDKFPAALAAVGLDPASPDFHQRLEDALNRVYPTAMAPVVASPVTPPAPGA